MGSRYDVNILRGVTIAQFKQSYSGAEVIGEEVPGPWEGPSGSTIAQIDTDSGSHVVIVGPPMRSRGGVDTLLARNLGIEALFATVWDSVSSYSLTVVGEGIDRHLSVEASEVEGEEDEEPAVTRTGDPLPEEPVWPGLDEAYVQTVCTARYGIDPGNLRKYEVTWYSFGPETQREAAIASETGEPAGIQPAPMSQPTQTPEPAQGFAPPSGSTPMPVPARGKRSKPKLIIGIVLTVIGGLALLGRMASLQNGTASGSGDAAEALGALIGSLLFIGIPLLIGILLIVSSKNSKPKR